VQAPQSDKQSKLPVGGLYNLKKWGILYISTFAEEENYANK